MFRNESTAIEIAKNGFVVLDANLESETKQFQTFISEQFKSNFSDFYYSLLANEFEKNCMIRDTFREILRPFYEKFFINHRTISESFLVKPAHIFTELLLHQDWCYTDEKEFSAYNIWIPLCDVTKNNGAMFFLPGSHLWFANLRSATLPTTRINSKDFESKNLVTVELKRGQVLLFHPAALHGSFPNYSDQDRIIVTTTILDKNAPFLFYQKSERANEVAVYKLEDDAYLRGLEKLAMGGVPERPAFDSIKYSHKIISVDDLQKFFH